MSPKVGPSASSLSVSAPRDEVQNVICEIYPEIKRVIGVTHP